jgi:hypothetical protein
MLGSCAPARSGGYIEPTINTVRAVTEQARTDPPANLIYVLNESSVSVRVFGVTPRGSSPDTTVTGWPISSPLHPDNDDSL